MRGRKRKEESHRDFFDAKRQKNEHRRGKGPLIPPREITVSPSPREFFGAGRTADFPDQADTRRPIPTPGFRLIDGEEEPDRYRDHSDNEEDEEQEDEREELEERSDDRPQDDPELERSASISATRGCGKAIYKGLLDKNRGCNCNVLVVEFDRGWREYGATVELHCGHRGWYICVLLQGETLFVQEIRRRFFHYTTNGFSGSFMWKADKGWILEFKNSMQLNAFKRVFEKCYQRNYTLSASRKVPAAKFQLVKDLDTRWRGPAFIRPPNGYIPTPDMNLENRVLYDMDAEDEQWLESLNGKAGGYTKISEPKFEKMMYTLEKYSYDHKEVLSLEAAKQFCLHVASLKIIKLVHAYWIEKRRRKGMSLVRHFQPERWKQYRDLPKPQKKCLFAFCMPPKGLEIVEASPTTVSSSSPVSGATVQESSQNPGGVENVGSPSLPEVLDEATTPHDEKEAESRGPTQTDIGFKKFVGTKEVRPQPGDLVWKKYTGRANPEEMKKLKVIQQMKKSGIKHFARRTKVPAMSKKPKPTSKSSKSSCNGSLTNDTTCSQEGTSDLLALAEAASLSPCSKARPATSTGEVETETESEIETPAKEVVSEASAIQEKVDEMIRQRAQLEKQVLKKQMSKLKQQMKMVNQQQEEVLDSSLPELQDFGTWSLELQKAMETLEEHRRKQQQLQQVKELVSVKVKRTNSRFSTLLLVVANSTTAPDVESS